MTERPQDKLEKHLYEEWRKAANAAGLIALTPWRDLGEKAQAPWRAVACAARPCLEPPHPGLEAGTSYLEAMAACDACGAPRVREVTGESITDEEIHHYRKYTVQRSGATSRQVDDAVRDCDQARPGYLSERARREAKALCAVGFNRMPESERLLTLAERIRWIAQNGQNAAASGRRRPADAAKDVLDQLRDELHALMMFKHQTRELKLLNAGTNNPREHHWRFRTPSGEIIAIAIEKEPSDEEAA